MTRFSHAAFMEELRRREGKVPKGLYQNLMAALEAGIAGKAPPAPAANLPGEPPWLSEARRYMGLKEIKGPRHNPKILAMVKALGGWFTDDETPWCGTFAAFCLQQTGHDVPKHWYRAKAYSSWGKASPPRVGAIAVFGRRGGGHVGFVVGESAKHYYIVGGNQGNMVSRAPIAKSRHIAFRWPSEYPLSDVRLPKMSGGAVSRDEA